MIATQQEVYAVMREFNPWWDGASDPDLPSWKRVAFDEVMQWLAKPPSRRAVLISGARQVGKTTLLRQAAHTLIESGVDPNQILYVTFDSAILKLMGLEQIIKIWEDLHAKKSGPEYLQPGQPWISSRFLGHTIGNSSCCCCANGGLAILSDLVQLVSEESDHIARVPLTSNTGLTSSALRPSNAVNSNFVLTLIGPDVAGRSLGPGDSALVGKWRCTIITCVNGRATIQ